MPLTLIRPETLKTGVVHLVYAPAQSAPEGTYEDAVEALSKARAGQQT